MISTGNDGNRFLLHGVNEAMRVIDSPRPIALQVKSEWFRFSDSFEGGQCNFFAQFLDALRFAGINSAPPQEVRICRFGEDDDHI